MHGAISRRGTLWVAGLAAVCAAGPLPAQSPSLPGNLTVADWRADLSNLAAQLPRRIGNGFEVTSLSAFRDSVASLDRRLPSLNADAIVVGLATIVASFGDPRTALQLPRDWPRYGVTVRWFGCNPRSVGPCELRVTSAAPGLERALGTHVLAIDSQPAESVHRRLLAMIPSQETRGAIWTNGGLLLQIANVLHGAGITRRVDTAQLTLQDSAGAAFTLDVPTRPRQTPKQPWRNAAAADPYSRQRTTEAFWWGAPDSQSVYFVFRGFPDTARLTKLSDQVIAFVNRRKATRLIIDLRGNGGGDFVRVHATLVPALKRHPVIGQPGHLYVLTGPGTLGSAATLAAAFRTEAGAMLVGLPTGMRPTGYEDVVRFELPRSHLVIAVAQRSFVPAPSETVGMRPDQRVEITWPLYRAGRDAPLDWVLAHPLTPDRPPTDGAKRNRGLHQP